MLRNQTINSLGVDELKQYCILTNFQFDYNTHRKSVYRLTVVYENVFEKAADTYDLPKEKCIGSGNSHLNSEWSDRVAAAVQIPTI